MTNLLSDVIATNQLLAKAWKKLSDLEAVDDELANEEIDHLHKLLEHFNKCVSKPYILRKNDALDFDEFRTDLLDYLHEKARKEKLSKMQAKAHNADLGPNYWCKEAFKTGEEATFEDLDVFLTSHDLEGTNETVEIVSEAYDSVLDIVEAEFSHSGSLSHIQALVDIELRREKKKLITEYVRRIIETCNLIKKEKRARKM